MCNDKDLINKVTKPCGCVVTTKLDLDLHITYDYFIKLCKSHYIKSSHSKKYSFNKNIKLYECNGYIKKLKKNQDKLKKYINISGDTSETISCCGSKTVCSCSPENCLCDIKKNPIIEKKIKFGKYKDQTFEFVYNNDKAYCFNLAFWENGISKNDDVIEFTSYIQNIISAC